MIIFYLLKGLFLGGAAWILNPLKVMTNSNKGNKTRQLEKFRVQ